MGVGECGSNAVGECILSLIIMSRVTLQTVINADRIVL